MSFTPPPNNPTSPPPAPSRQDQSEEEFDLKANAMVAWYAVAMAWFTGFVEWIRTFVVEMNSAMTTIDQAKQTAIDEANLAMGYRNQAGNSATTAQGAAATATTKAGEASTSAGQAAGYASDANTAKIASQAARDQTYAFGGQMLTATSTTSLALGNGTKTLTTQVNKAFAAGMRLTLASAADPVGFQMSGIVNTYNRDTGAMEFIVTSSTGTGSKADWSITVAGANAAGSLPVVVVTTNTTVLPNTCYIVAAANVILTISSTWNPGDKFAIREAIGSGSSYTIDFTANFKVRSQTKNAVVIAANYSQLDMAYQDTTRGFI